MNNTLYYGDNLPILRELASDSIDLVYLDPPFNSKRDYNIIFREQSGEPAQAQIKAFTDTWKWSELAYHDFSETCRNDDLVKLVKGFVDSIGRNDVTAYLIRMAPRLLELHRILKPNGSIYLHCDPTASHYLKLLLDRIFSPRNFCNEVIWSYRKWATGWNYFQRNHDVIFFYRKLPNDSHRTFNRLYMDRAASTLKRFGTAKIVSSFDETGRRLPSQTESHDSEGVAMDDVWNIPRVPPIKQLYPTQKPLALLERIIAASSNPGDIVLDPFCGCGTATVAAQKLGRRWIGVDITHLAVSLIKSRLDDAFGLKEKKDYTVVGEPATDADAHALALNDRYEFQKWAVGLIPRAFPYQDKKGADSGIDGIVRFKDDKKEPKRCIIQVKSGKVGVAQVRDFRGALEREKATLGLFITLDPPTDPMLSEAERLGFYTTPLGSIKIKRLQIRTVAQLLEGESFQIPGAAMLLGIKQADVIESDPGQADLEYD